MMIVFAIAVLILTVSDGRSGGIARVSDCHRMDETQRLGEPSRRSCGDLRQPDTPAIRGFPTGKAKIHSAE
jgi:hypothetical protein